MTRWLLPIALLLALAGYVGPWIDHPVAGLVITGLDLGEYAKFLYVVRNGTVNVWREGFYSPLVAISTVALLAAYRVEVAYPWWVRSPLLALSAIAAFNLVPPAWTPMRLLESEFRLQTASLLLLLTGLVLAPLLALLPRVFVASVATPLVLVSIVAPIYGFAQILPALQLLYQESLKPAWGIWLMVIGLLLMLISIWRVPSAQKR